jgi:hypothetical protein
MTLITRLRTPRPTTTPAPSNGVSGPGTPDQTTV